MVVVVVGSVLLSEVVQYSSEPVALPAVVSALFVATVSGLSVSLRSFSPGSGSSSMIASKSAYTSSVRGTSLPSQSATPVVGTVTKVIRPALMPCSDCPNRTRSRVWTLST